MNHTITLYIARSVCRGAATSDGLISIYALSAHGKVIIGTKKYSWAERLWKL